MILINFSSRFLISETSSSSDQRSHGPLDDTRMQIADWSKQNPKPEKKNKKKNKQEKFHSKLMLKLALYKNNAHSSPPLNKVNTFLWSEWL